MLLRITHRTDLAYSELISESVMELRMSPRQEEGQHRLSFALAVGPATTVASYFDWLGNTVHALTINGFHNAVSVVATSVVQTERRPVETEYLPSAWPVRRESLDYSMYDYLQFAGPIVDCAALREVAGRVRAREGDPLGSIGKHVLHLVHDQFRYQKGVTTAASPITEILEHGQGVCQDFTHLMIGLARAMGIPARYVSGFIHRDGQALRGYAQTHAWCELYFPSYGWVGFDPTNNCLVGANFIKLAHGRDYRDVPPNRGVYRGTGTERIDVAVETEELAELPTALVGERFASIDLAVQRRRRAVDQSEGVMQQQEQQQQELRQQQEQQQQEQGQGARG